MSDDELEEIWLRKAEMLLKFQLKPKKIINIYDDSEINNLLKDFPEKVVVIDFWSSLNVKEKEGKKNLNQFYKRRKIIKLRRV